MIWEEFARMYSPKTFLEALYVFDLWVRRNGGRIR